MFGSINIFRWQVFSEILSLIELCRVQLKIIQLTSTMSDPDLVCSFLIFVILYMRLHIVRDHVSYRLSCLELWLQKTALAGPPDILVSTPACLQSCFSKGFLLPASVQDSLSFLVLDEVPNQFQLSNSSLVVKILFMKNTCMIHGLCRFLQLISAARLFAV